MNTKILKPLSDKQLFNSFDLYNRLTYASRYKKWVQDLLDEGLLIRDPDGRLYQNKGAVDIMVSALKPSLDKLNNN